MWSHNEEDVLHSVLSGGCYRTAVEYLYIINLYYTAENKWNVSYHWRLSNFIIQMYWVSDINQSSNVYNANKSYYKQQWKNDKCERTTPKKPENIHNIIIHDTFYCHWQILLKAFIAYDSFLFWFHLYSQAWKTVHVKNTTIECATIKAPVYKNFSLLIR